MKQNRRLLDAFVISGFVASFFSGFLNPLYISLILARLDPSVIAVGSFMASGFPVLVGLALGRPAVFQKLYGALPLVMLAELVAALGSAVLAAVDLRAYYLVSMFVLGAFSSAVVYLLQKIKEVRYRRNRASFDRRCDMADAAGLLLGSAAAIAGLSVLRDARAVAVAGVVQTAAVYGLFLLVFRKVPPRRGRPAEEEAHPWGTPTLLPAPIDSFRHREAEAGLRTTGGLTPAYA